MEYLLYSPDDRAGALGFGLNQTPPAPKRSFNQTLDLAKLQSIADSIVADDDRPDGDRAAAGVADPGDDRDQVEKLIALVAADHGAVDILVNAVGGSTVIANPLATTEQLKIFYLCFADNRFCLCCA